MSSTYNCITVKMLPFVQLYVFIKILTLWHKILVQSDSEMALKTGVKGSARAHAYMTNVRHTRHNVSTIKKK